MRPPRTIPLIVASIAVALALPAGAQVKTNAGADAAAGSSGQAGASFNSGGIAPIGLTGAQASPPSLPGTLTPALSAPALSLNQGLAPSAAVWPVPAASASHEAPGSLPEIAAAQPAPSPLLKPASRSGHSKPAILETGSTDDSADRDGADVHISHAAKARRAKELIEGVDRTWTREELLLEVDRTLPRREPADSWIPSFKARTDRISRLTAGLGPVEKLAARGVLAPEISRLNRRIEEIKRLDHDAMLGDDASRGVDEELRALVDELRPYAPALSADRIVNGRHDLADPSVRGLSFIPYLRDGRWLPHSVWIAPDLDLRTRVHTLVHEGIHQADVGYVRGYRALFVLFGPAGPNLHVPLIEGYTEWRTLRALDRLYQDGIAGGGTLSRDYAGVHDAKAAERHPYRPYVRFVEALLSLPGGQDALDAFVRDGDPTGLYAVLGGERMKFLAELSAQDLADAVIMDRAELYRRSLILAEISRLLEAPKRRNSRWDIMRDFLQRIWLAAAYPSALIAGGILSSLGFYVLAFSCLAVASGAAFLLIRRALKAAASARRRLRQLDL